MQKSYAKTNDVKKHPPASMYKSEAADRRDLGVEPMKSANYSKSIFELENHHLLSAAASSGATLRSLPPSLGLTKYLLLNNSAWSGYFVLT